MPEWVVGTQLISDKRVMQDSPQEANREIIECLEGLFPTNKTYLTWDKPELLSWVQETQEV